MIFQEECPVIFCNSVCTNTFILRIAAPSISAGIQPGQMVFVRTTERTVPLLRRPFSPFDVDVSEKTMDILFEVVGKGTRLLSRKRPGDKLSIIGPSGNGFPFKNNRAIIAVAGGMGLAPIHFLCKRATANRSEVFFYYGAQNSDRLVTRELPEAQQACIATDDGSYGKKGFVTEMIESQGSQLPGNPIVFACGPEPMLKCMTKIAAAHKWPCHVSLERHMACGVGACNGCITDVIDEEGKISHQRVCTEGPVFAAEKMAWN